jgi:peptidyl-prolyl cis-trans isomerase D
MLAGIKKNITGWVAYAIIAIIAIPFALFGINQYFTGNQNIVVAEVGDAEISRLEYLNALQRLINNAKQALGDDYSDQIEVELKRRAINTLVERKILESLANDLNLATLDDEIKAEILTNEAFTKDNKFDLDTYTQVLNMNGYSVKQYENELLRARTNLQFRDNLINASFLTSAEKQILTNLLDEQRNISFSEINFGDLAKNLKISDKQIKDYYDANQDKLINPQAIKINFISLNAAAIAKSIEPTDAQITELYEVEKSRWQTEEERAASHILLEDEKLAQEILAKVKNGEDFAQLATQNSKDPLSAENDGSLGFFTRGIMMPEFEEVVFKMQIDEISEIVKTEFGYHIIKLDDISEAKTKALAEVRSEVVDLYKQTKVAERIFTLSEELQNIVYEQGLEAAAEDLNLKIQTSEFITNTNTDFAAKVVRAAFSDEVLKNNEAVVVEVSPTEVIALNKNNFKAKSNKTLTEAKDEITQILTTNEATKQANVQADKLINSKAKLNKDLGWVYRNHQDNEVARVVNLAFSETSSNTYFSHNLGDKLVVIKIADSRIKERENTRNLDILAGDYADELFSDVVEHLKQNSNVKIFNNLL